MRSIFFGTQSPAGENFPHSNGRAKDAVIYFGPMGCQTGFYFLFDSRMLSEAEAVELLKEAFAAGAAYEGEMPGKSAVECGNYINLDLALAISRPTWPFPGSGSGCRSAAHRRRPPDGPSWAGPR